MRSSLAGDQIDYADEMPMVRRMFADALAKRGLTPRMDQAYSQELAESAAAGEVGVMQAYR